MTGQFVVGREIACAACAFDSRRPRSLPPERSVVTVVDGLALCAHHLQVAATDVPQSLPGLRIAQQIEEVAAARRRDFVDLLAAKPVDQAKEPEQ